MTGQKGYKQGCRNEYCFHCTRSGLQHELSRARSHVGRNSERGLQRDETDGKNEKHCMDRPRLTAETLKRRQKTGLDDRFLELQQRSSLTERPGNVWNLLQEYGKAGALLKHMLRAGWSWIDSMKEETHCVGVEGKDHNCRHLEGIPGLPRWRQW